MTSMNRTPDGHRFLNRSSTSNRKYASLWVLLWLLLASMVFGQESQLEVINSNTEEIIVFQVNDRVRVVTQRPNKQRITGRISFVNEDTILIRKNKIAILDIDKIKPAPLGYSIASSVVTWSLGSIAMLGMVAGCSIGCDTAVGIAFIIVGIPVTGYTYKGLFVAPNILKGYKKKDGWTFRVMQFN